MKSKIISLLYIILFFTGLNSQEIISYSKIKTMTKGEISSTYFIPAKYDVAIYKIIYTTKNLNFETDTASGILAASVDPGKKFPILIYDHGTVGNRHDVPSEGSSEQLLAAAIASYGYHCVAPDYIGLGVSKGLHPYIHPDSEAWAGIDLARSVKYMETPEDVHFNEQVFVTGYSQGGHSAMATAKRLQETDDEFIVTAAAPMSGPYSVEFYFRRCRVFFLCLYW